MRKMDTKITKKTVSYRMVACVRLLLAKTKGSYKREKLLSRAAWNIEKITFFISFFDNTYKLRL